MADVIPGQTREGLAILFFNAIVGQEQPDGKYSRAYALDLLAEIVRTIDGKREAPAPNYDAEPVVAPMPELEAELAAEAPVAGNEAASADVAAEAAPEPKRRGRPPKVAPEPPSSPARRGRPRRS